MPDLESGGRARAVGCRLPDLSGREVPQACEDYELAGELGHLPGFWKHNLRDIATLADLLAKAATE